MEPQKSLKGWEPAGMNEAIKYRILTEAELEKCNTLEEAEKARFNIAKRINYSTMATRR